MRNIFKFLCLIFLIGVLEVNGHGRLMWPPARGTIFRHQEFSNLNPVPNYNDNELNCGNLTTQWEVNGGKCGECGDNYSFSRPRPNESGGEFDKGIIVSNYTSGQEIDVHVQLTANHLGYFEFRLCEHNNPGTPEEQTCFDKNLLEIVSTDSKSEHTQEPVLETVMEYYLKLKLPQGLTCEQCILQWHYFAGNNWGDCEDGSGGVGCGEKQEVFRGCSDIGIF